MGDKRCDKDNCFSKCNHFVTLKLLTVFGFLKLQQPPPKGVLMTQFQSWIWYSVPAVIHPYDQLQTCCSVSPWLFSSPSCPARSPQMLVLFRHPTGFHTLPSNLVVNHSITFWRFHMFRRQGYGKRTGCFVVGPHSTISHVTIFFFWVQPQIASTQQPMQHGNEAVCGCTAWLQKHKLGKWQLLMGPKQWSRFFFP